MDAIKKLNRHKRHYKHTSHPTSSYIKQPFSTPLSSSPPPQVPPTIPTPIKTSIFSPTNVIASKTISASEQTMTEPITPSSSKTSTLDGNSKPIIQESDRVPIAIAISSVLAIFLITLLVVYIRKRRRQYRQKALASAIVAAEAGELPRSATRDSPSPPPPPPPPPSTPTPPYALLSYDNKPASPRYKISTLEIEPMTKRLTMNLSQKGKSIVINEDNRSPTQARRGIETTDIQEEEDDESCQEIINVMSLRDDDNSDDENNQGGSSKGKFKGFSVRKNFSKK